MKRWTLKQMVSEASERVLQAMKRRVLEDHLMDLAASGEAEMALDENGKLLWRTPDEAFWTKHKAELNRRLKELVDRDFHRALQAELEGRAP